MHPQLSGLLSSESSPLSVICRLLRGAPFPAFSDGRVLVKPVEKINITLTPQTSRVD